MKKRHPPPPKPASFFEGAISAPSNLIRDLEASQRDLGKLKTMVEAAERMAGECLALPEEQLKYIQAELCQGIVEFEDILLAGWKCVDQLRAKAAALGLTVELRKARLTTN